MPARTLQPCAPRRNFRAGLIILAAAVTVAGTAVAVVHARHSVTLSAADAKASPDASRMPAGTAPEPPALTRTQAERVISNYSAVNNQANASYSSSELAKVEASNA
jgi:hypothetical protein